MSREMDDAGLDTDKLISMMLDGWEMGGWQAYLDDAGWMRDCWMISLSWWRWLDERWVREEKLILMTLGGWRYRWEMTNLSGWCRMDAEMDERCLDDNRIIWMILDRCRDGWEMFEVWQTYLDDAGLMKRWMRDGWLMTNLSGWCWVNEEMDERRNLKLLMNLYVEAEEREKKKRIWALLSNVIVGCDACCSYPLCFRESFLHSLSLSLSDH